MEENHDGPTLQLQVQTQATYQGEPGGAAGTPVWAEPVALTVCMKQCSLSSCAYSTLSLMNTEIALNMNDTKRFMWMKLRVQCSFLHRTDHDEQDSPSGSPENWLQWRLGLIRPTLENSVL